MTAEQLYQIVADRELRISVDAIGRPIVSGNKERLTPALIEALKTHRNEILQMLGLGLKPPKVIETSEPPTIECLWPGNGYEGPHYYPQHGWPVGAYFYRNAGETEWLPIPGREWDEKTKRGKVEKVQKTKLNWKTVD